MREAFAYFDAWLDYRLWKLCTPDAQVAVWFDGTIQFSKAYGVSNLDMGEPLTTSHLFRIASHSKTFTATAIMQLVVAGKLRLDDSVGSWIPELTEAGSLLAEGTVRQIVSHSAGIIRDGVDATYWAHHRPFPNEDELLELAIREGEVRQPDATFTYTNIGYSLLGMIIGKAASSTYNAYTQTAIIEKLGLRNTGPELDDAPVRVRGRSRRAQQLDQASGHSARRYAFHGGSDRDRRRASIMSGADCRVPVAFHRHRSPGRYAVARSKVTPDQAVSIRADYAGGRSLRDLAVSYGVSHETIRQIVRRVQEQATALFWAPIFG